MTNEQTPQGGEFRPSTERWREAQRYLLALAHGQVDGQLNNQHMVPTDDIDTQGAYVVGRSYIYRDKNRAITGLAVTVLNEQEEVAIEFAGGQPDIKVYATNGNRYNMFVLSTDGILARPSSYEHSFRLRDPNEPSLSSSAVVLNADPAELDQRLGGDRYWLPAIRIAVDQAIASQANATVTMHVATGLEEARQKLREEAATDFESTFRQGLREFSDATGIMYIDDWLAQNPPPQP